MKNHHLLWATGEDQPGIVAGVCEHLYKLKCNIEDSSMMRLGSEFGILLIFSSPSKMNAKSLTRTFHPLEKKLKLNLGCKKISMRQAQFTQNKNPLYTVSVHGSDRPGIVYHVTRHLSRFKFNITDLTTHRTESGKKPGFILIIEGEIPNKIAAKTLAHSLRSLGKKMSSRIQMHPLSTYSL